MMLVPIIILLPASIGLGFGLAFMGLGIAHLCGVDTKEILRKFK